MKGCNNRYLAAVDLLVMYHSLDFLELKINLSLKIPKR